MELELPTAGLEHYKSASQRARVATEAWAETNLYCPNCDSDRLKRFPTNTPVVDFACLLCHSSFQLKSQSHPFARRIPDAAYSKMRAAILSDQRPNLFALHYEREFWRVRNLILVPRFAVSLSAVRRRNPLSADAERSGWVGCDILLERIPANARIHVIIDGVPSGPGFVREQYGRLRPLQEIAAEERGWTLDVLSVLRSLGRHEFLLGEVYLLEGELARLHPRNRRIRAKIRQQLQILRDKGLLRFLGRGRYRLL